MKKKEVDLLKKDNRKDVQKGFEGSTRRFSRNAIKREKCVSNPIQAKMMKSALF